VAEVQVIIRAIDKMTSTTNKVRSGIGGLVDSLKSTAIVMAGVVAAGYAVKKVFDATVGSVMNYNKSILDAAKASGTTVDQFSRIVQIADDVGISMGDVETSLAMATKRGFAPSIDALAGLADRLNAIDSPTARAAAAAKIFGRNWAALDPLLQQGGKAIRDNAAAVEDGLVVTEQEVAATEETRMEIDALNDSWVALKNTIGQDAAPAITDALSRINTSIEQHIDLLDIARLGLEMTFGSTPKNILDLFAAAAKNVGSEAHGIVRSFEAIPGTVGEIASATATMADIPSIWDKIFPSPAEMAGKLQDQIDFIQAGGPSLVAAIENVQAALAEGVITPEQAEEMLGPLSAATQGLMVELGQTDIWAAAKARAAEMGITFDQARKDIEIGVTAIGTIPQEIDIKINWIMENPTPPPGGFQNGGSFIVPGMGSGDRPYVMQLEPGERVDVTPRSQVKNFTFNTNVSDGTDGAVLLSRFQDAARRS
jgi:hypothetical protein